MELFEEGFWKGLHGNLSKKEKDDLRRAVFFSGSFFFSAKAIPALEAKQLPLELTRGDKTDGDVMTCVNVVHFGPPTELVSSQPKTTVKPGEVSFETHGCSNCTKSFVDMESMLRHCRDAGHTPKYTGGDGPAPADVFISYVSLALQRALGEHLARWGREYIDPKDEISRPDLGVSVFPAYVCSFGITSANGGKPCLTLTTDLKAKIIRTTSVLDAIYVGKGEGENASFSEQEKNKLKRQWVGETVIYKNDKRST